MSHARLSALLCGFVLHPALRLRSAVSLPRRKTRPVTYMMRQPNTSRLKDATSPGPGGIVR